MHPVPPGTAVRAGERSLRAYTEREAELHTFVWVDADRVGEEAAGIDARPPGPLTGLSIGVKDVFDTHDAPTERGSAIFAGRRPTSDAASVACLRRAGGLVLGKTATAELACMTPAATRNPHDPGRTPGGSSSGSAAAVAAAIVDAALGTQTAGSISRPASYCGVVGYKPSFGLVSRDGVLECAQSLDTVGVIARDVEVTARVGAVLTGDDSLGRRDTPPQGVRVGVIWPTAWSSLEPAARAALDEARRRLESIGAEVNDVELTGALADAVATHRVVMRSELARSLGPLLDRQPTAVSAALAEAIDEGRQYGIDARRDADADRREADAGMHALLEDCHVLLAPAASGEAEVGLGYTGDPACSAPWTLLGVPTLTIPSVQGPGGMPVGVTLTTGRFRDRLLFDLAARLDLSGSS